ncbi:NAD(P)/FAD-dependent oxidoreductase [Mucilaginibacter myungsuensis]|uniref:FAD-binding oxidoreductase n=1 Tax=Mucilaginibacter myungsuensis TaxID=649104 RepID=A0A929PWL7_9SPHI|nr:FAD-binding oxidoreductase [Mucilaginibacter myungsuensis]MBE9661312.1 FAD-binding oxidoreductase [Mucilaginibacter myungsuensis]MDN3597455.1 FAD-binding oxidoreductase [Mucilaginibacter myungsuensis]
MDNFSYWERTAFTGRADVIIVGSGLVGLSAALSIKQQHPDKLVLVLERGFLPSGASTKNAGFACFGTASELLDNIQRSSPEEALKLVDYKWRGLQRLRQNLGDDNIRYHQHGGYELFLDHEQAEADSIIEQLPYLNDLLRPLFKTDVYQAADQTVGHFGFKSVKRMIYNLFEGQIHTGYMMRTLLHKVYQTGTIVLNNCTVTDIKTEDKGVQIETDQGVFQAGKVILATNAFAKDLYPELDVIPGRGQVLVTKPIPGLKLKGTYHFNEGYYYFRNIDDRILFGGGRNIDFAAEETTDFGHTEAVQQQLLTYLREVIAPGQPTEPDIWWSGIMGFGEQLSPLIKEVRPNVYCAVRCNGMGVAMGSLVGEEVAMLAMQP